MTGATPIYHHNISQHTPEWSAIRAGKWTASNAATIMGGLATAGLEALIKDIAWARVFGPQPSGYQSAAMARGNELESEAFGWYVQETDAAPQSMGFVEHGSIPHVGWSPDAVNIGYRHGLEIKCPLHRAWLDVKRTMAIPSEYLWQCRWAIWVGDLLSLHFLAYHPDAGGIVLPMWPDENYADMMAERVAILEPRVAKWVEIIGNSRNAFFRPKPKSVPVAGEIELLGEF